MQVLDEVNGESVRQFADKFIQLHAMVNTDMLNIYNVFGEPDYDHLSQIFNPVTNPDPRLDSHLHLQRQSLPRRRLPRPGQKVPSALSQ
jgi:hypothetical protein